jgi:F0F1-type ATP synthase beta subunit
MEQRYGIGIIYPGVDPVEIVSAVVKHGVQLVGSEEYGAAVDYEGYLQAQQKLDTRLALLFVFPDRLSVWIDDGKTLGQTLSRYIEEVTSLKEHSSVS